MMTNLHKNISARHILTLTASALAVVALIAVGAMTITDPEPAQAQSPCFIDFVQHPSAIVDEEAGPYHIEGTCDAPNYISYGLWNVTDDEWLIGPTTQWVNTDGIDFSATTDWTFSSVGDKQVEARVNYDADVGTYTYSYADRDVRTITVSPAGGGGGGSGGSCSWNNSVPGEEISYYESVEAVLSAYGKSDSESVTHTINFSDYIDTDEYVKSINFRLRTEGTIACSHPDPGCYFSADASGLGASVGVTGGTTMMDSSDSDSDVADFSRDIGSGVTEASFDLSWSYDLTLKEGEHGSVSVLAEVKDIELEVCDTGPGNDAPVAVDDGTPDHSERTPINIGEPKNLDVMDNDYDPDDGPVSPIYLTGTPTTDRVGSSVLINDGQLLYDPGSLTYGEYDQINYQISDGADTDTATAYIRIVNKTAPVEITVDALEGATYQPKWDGDYLNQVTGNHIFTVELDKTARLFEIIEDEVQICCGYEHELKQPDWIKKTVPVQDFTGNDWSALLGLTYTEDSGPSSCSVVDTVDVTSAEIDVSVIASNGSSPSDSDSSTVTFSDYTSGGDYVSELTYTSSVLAELTGDCFGGDPGCSAFASASGVSAQTPPGNTDSETQTFTNTYSETDTTTSEDFSVDVSASSPSTHVHGGRASASVGNIQLKICDGGLETGVEAKATTELTRDAISGSGQATYEFDASGSTGSNLTYEWEYTGSDPSGYFASIVSPNSEVTDVFAENKPPYDYVTFNFLLTVTDSVSGESDTETVSVGFSCSGCGG
ncbi:MAG: hypothetical protein WD335_00995 [Candidatus Paceibacterota bacterium]